jgi:L-threonylcarbamoyladenylate synthase
MIAAQKVREGAVIVYPTDTVYGIGCEPYNDDAIESLLRMKGRENSKPMPLLCSSIMHAERIGRLDDDARKLANRFWPGALTIIVKLNDYKISSKVTGGKDSVGIRVPDHTCALKLIEACGGVLVGTSANRSGSPSARNADEVINSIKGFDILIDGGKTQGIESTVLSVIDHNITIIREGAVKRKEIERVLTYDV